MLWLQVRGATSENLKLKKIQNLRCQRVIEIATTEAQHIIDSSKQRNHTPHPLALFRPHNHGHTIEVPYHLFFKILGP